MYFRKTCFSPTLVVYLFWDLTKCLKLCARLEQVQPKSRTGKKKVAEYIRTHDACIELCVTRVYMANT